MDLNDELSDHQRFLYAMLKELEKLDDRVELFQSEVRELKAQVEDLYTKARSQRP